MSSSGPSSSNIALGPPIKDIVRNQQCVRGAVYLVEAVDEVLLPAENPSQHIQRLLLSDGSICIQSLLLGVMHHLVHDGQIAVGRLLRLDQALFRHLRRHTGGFMVYLELEAVQPLGWHPAFQPLQEAAASQNQSGLDTGGSATNQKPSANTPLVAAATQTRNSQEIDLRDVNDTADTPQVTGILPVTAATLHEPSRVEVSMIRGDPVRRESILSAQNGKGLGKPLKLTALRQIPHLPYKQNWSCNVLAIIAELSPVQSSHLPPYKQRTARITDPSTSKQVHLTVFLEPESFTPRVGSAVLLLGVKNHIFDGGSLKKYASDKRHGVWWFEDPFEAEWCDVAGIKRWWAEATTFDVETNEEGLSMAHT